MENKQLTIKQEEIMLEEGREQDFERKRQKTEDVALEEWKERNNAKSGNRIGMTREIKFRMYDKEEKKFIITEFSNLKLSQFTGLKDNNGKEIYEGDIVQGNNFIAIVKWMVHLGGFMCHRKNADGEVEEYININDYKIEVIGNVYENPKPER